MTVDHAAPVKSETFSNFDLTTAANRVHKLIDSMKASAVEIGREFITIKAKLPHGEFGKWIAAEFRMTDRTAQNYMNAAAAVNGNAVLAVLPDKALYLLGAKNTHIGVVEKVVKAIEAGHVPAVRVIEADVQAARKQAAQEREEAAKIAAKTIGMSPADAARKAKKIKEDQRKRAAANKAKDEARREEMEREHDESKEVGKSAVAFLEERLGNRFDEFAALYKRANAYGFAEAMRRAKWGGNPVVDNAGTPST